MNAQRTVKNRRDAEERGLEWSVLSRPAGPIAAQFMNDLSPLTYIMGPVGGGKTTACVGKGMNIARRQQPSIKDGVRKVRIAAVRDTYRNLWDSLIPSYQKIFPPHYGKGQKIGADKNFGWTGGKGEPARHRMLFEDPHHGTLDVEFTFHAIGEQNLEDFIRGREVTAFWLNETDRLPADSIGQFAQRVGRFKLDELPDPDSAVKCVFGDFNAPDEDNWLAQRMQKELEIDWFYIQPSGLSPDAENIQNLGSSWYPNQCRLMEEWEIKRYIENRIGFSRQGEPVYRDYGADTHDIGDHIKPDPRLKLIIGIDGGGTAAAVMLQKDTQDIIRVLDEIVTPDDQRTDGYSFGVRVGEFLSTPAHGYASILDRGDFLFVADPANFHGGHETGKTFMDAFASGFEKATGLRCRMIPAETNDPETRQGAVRRPMAQLVSGKPRLLFCKRAIVLRRGAASGYKLRKSKNAAGDVTYSPVKNHYSHVHDALQYGCLYLVGVTFDRAKSSGYAGPGARARLPGHKPKIKYHSSL